ncbi:hypothetical protein ACHAWF_009222, partial [Thalassiosira exigua]
LLRGEIGGEDVKLVFVEKPSASASASAVASGDSVDALSSDRNNVQVVGRKRARDGDAGAAAEAAGESRRGEGREREISAHKAFLRSCGIVRAAFEGDRFAESGSGEMRVVVPPGTFGAVDALMRWCYDGRCRLDVYERKTNFLVLERYAHGIPALWALADFVQCVDLCEAIVGTLRTGRLRSGREFAILVEEAKALGVVDALVGAALEGLPLQLNRREDLEDLLDFGAAEMLGAMAECHDLYPGGKSSDDGEEGATGQAADENLLVRTLGNYLAEMKRGDRGKMAPSLFARCLAQFPPGTVSEADYAKMVMDYIEDYAYLQAGTVTSESCIVALLGSIDFGAISREALVLEYIPRVERIFPPYALIVNDFTSVASSIITRCPLSNEVMSAEGNVFFVVSCGNILSHSTAKSVTAVWGREIDCPFCIRYNKRHRLKWKDLRKPLTKIDRLRSYFERKRTKSDALKCWALSHDRDNNIAVERQTRARVENTIPRTKPIRDIGLSVRILNLCSSIGRESEIFCRIQSLDSKVDLAIDAFAKQVELVPESIGFFHAQPGGSLGEQISNEVTWRQLEFTLQGSDSELIIARRIQSAGKPVIRMYSDDFLENVNVSLELKGWSDILTYPRAITGPSDMVNGHDKDVKFSWKVKVNSRETHGDHSSTIGHHSDDGMWRTYSYLFWEASTMRGFAICPSSASCVRSNELSKGLLQDALLAQGLTVDEATEMATHWLPAMTKKKYVLIEFLQQDRLDKRAKLEITPSPDRVHRVFILFHPTDNEICCDCPLVKSPPLLVPRTGFCVVEWGGMEC